MVYRFLDTVFSGGEIKTNIGLRLDASLPQGAQQELENLSRELPGSISEQYYWDEERKAGELAMSALLVKNVVKVRQLQRSAASQIRGAVLQDKTGQMRAAMGVAQQDLRYQQTAIAHNIMLGGAQQQMTGYAAAASNARTLV